jgi:hypothetical protein
MHSGIGLVGGALISAVIVGMGSAHADDADEPPVIESLFSAAADLSKSITDLESVHDYSGPGLDIIIPDLKDFLSQLPGDQYILGRLMASDNSSLTLLDALFSVLDQQLAEDADITLTASQAFVDYPSPDGVGLLLGDVEALLVNSFEEIAVNYVGGLVDQLEGLLPS